MGPRRVMNTEDAVHGLQQLLWIILQSGHLLFPQNQISANGRQPVPTESWPGSSPGPRISCQRGASKAEAVALAGAETRGKAEKRAVGWAGGAEWGIFRIFPFSRRFCSISDPEGKLLSDICKFQNGKSSSFSRSFRDLYLFSALEGFF